MSFDDKVHYLKRSHRLVSMASFKYASLVVSIVRERNVTLAYFAWRSSTGWNGTWWTFARVHSFEICNGGHSYLSQLWRLFKAELYSKTKQTQDTHKNKTNKQTKNSLKNTFSKKKSLKIVSTNIGKILLSNYRRNRKWKWNFSRSGTF